MSSCGRAVASPPWRRGCQVRAPWRHGGHGVVDVVGPVAPPGRASGRDDSGVYTDRRKQPLGAILGHLCTLLRRCGQAWGRRSVHRSAKMAPRSRFGPFVYTVATRVASGGTRAPVATACRRLLLASPSRLVGKTDSARAAPPGWRLRRGSNPHKPPKSRQICRKIPSCRKLVFPKLASILSCCLFHSSLCMAAKWGGTLLDRAPLPPSPGGWKVG